MSIEFTNNASGTLSVQLDGATPGPEDTTLVLQANEGQLFPPVTTASGNFFYASVEDTSGNIEIVRCTDVSTDTLTITRAQENTTSQTFAVGSKVELRTTAATFAEFIQRTGGVMTGNLDLDGNQLIDPVVTSTGAAVIQNVPLRGADNGTANQLLVPSGGGDPTIGVNTIIHTGNDTAYVQTTRTLTGGEGIAAIGDLQADRTVDLDINELTTIAGTNTAAGDQFLMYDLDAATHKVMNYRSAGVPIITDSTVNPQLTDDTVNSMWILDHSVAPITFDFDTGIGEQGNVVIWYQADATQQVTIGGTATTVSASTNKRTRRQYSMGFAICTSANNWILYGDLE